MAKREIQTGSLAIRQRLSKVSGNLDNYKVKAPFRADVSEIDFKYDDQSPRVSTDATILSILKQNNKENVHKNIEIESKPENRLLNHKLRINDHDQNGELFGFLKGLNLEHLKVKFDNNLITFRDLKLLTRQDYLDMNIPIGPRNRILRTLGMPISSSTAGSPVNSARGTNRSFNELSSSLATKPIPIAITISDSSEKTSNYSKYLKPEVENFLHELSALRSRKPPISSKGFSSKENSGFRRR